VLSAGGFAIGVALSVSQGLRQQVGHDFHVFWQAGRNFAAGSPLYHDYLPGARQFKYPPFAAFVFQLLALFPLPVAAVLFSLLNLVLWVVAIYLTWDIVARTFPNRNSALLPLGLAFVLSAQFFLDNFHHVQVNALILVLVLLGIRAYLGRQDVRAAVYLVSATAIKLTPIFFVAWLLVRGRRRAVLAVGPVALACLLLPLLIRGPATGAAEIVEYYHSFLEEHQHGQVGTYTAGQNLAALVNRITLTAQEPDHASYIQLPVSARTAQLAYQGLWLAGLLLFLAKLVHLRVRRAPLTAFELSLIFLTSLLLSPITFTTHLVSLLFVFYAFLAVRPAGLSPVEIAVAAVLCLAMAVTGLSGRDLVGRPAYWFVRDHSIYAWTLLLLFGAALVLAGREPSTMAGATDPPPVPPGR
jgi:alpha-1,2-mannosyltransferase